MSLMTAPRPAHMPVLLARVLELFDDVPAGWIIDGTLGRAGHTLALLEHRADLCVLGLDRDPQAVAESAELLAPYGGRARVVHARFDRMAEIAAEVGAEPIVGILLDLGVSSPQIDEPERGFSYRFDAPLDMRMDTTQRLTAADVVNTYSVADLARVLRELGDERFAERIASTIVANRPVTRTLQLVDLIRDAIPAPARRTGGHPAKRTFQAIRIEVNGELASLADALDAGMGLLVPGGRFVCLAYHSGEDRIVKARFRLGEDGGCTCPPGLPCVCGAVRTGRLLKRGAYQATAEEIAGNPRAESARLRAFEALMPSTGRGTR